LPNFTEESLQTQNNRVTLPAVDKAISNLQELFPNLPSDKGLLEEAISKQALTADLRDAAHAQMVSRLDAQGATTN